MATIGKVSVEFKVDTSAYLKGIAKAKARLERALANIKAIKTTVILPPSRRK